jgi:hypothetical protein
LTCGIEGDFTSGMAEAKTYSGGCHCGKVRYDVTTDLARIIECNCSICSKKAALLTFVPVDVSTLKPTPFDGKSR